MPKNIWAGEMLKSIFTEEGNYHSWRLYGHNQQSLRTYLGEHHLVSFWDTVNFLQVDSIEYNFNINHSLISCQAHLLDICMVDVLYL